MIGGKDKAVQAQQGRSGDKEEQDAGQRLYSVGSLMIVEAVAGVAHSEGEGAALALQHVPVVWVVLCDAITALSAAVLVLGYAVAVPCDAIGEVRTARFAPPPLPPVVLQMAVYSRAGVACPPFVFWQAVTSPRVQS
jgi:hypothetical protein